MKALSHFLVIFFVLIYSNSKAQTDLKQDPRVDPLLKQAASRQPGLHIYSRKDGEGGYVNMAILREDTRQLKWFTCHGKVFDSIQPGKDAYNQLASGTLDPFSFYRDYRYEDVFYITEAERLYRLHGKAALEDTAYNNRIIFNIPSIKLAGTMLQRIVAIESLMKKKYLQLRIFDSKSPRQLTRNHIDSSRTRNALAGMMLTNSNGTVFFNADPVAAAARIEIRRQSPNKLFVYNHEGKRMDSVPLKPGKYSSLLSDREDVFLLYRGWLELQWQQAEDRKQQYLSWLNNLDSGLYKPTSGATGKRQIREELISLQQRQDTINEKINNLIIPDEQYAEQLVLDAHGNEASEISYLPGLGFAYSISYMRGQRTYELTDTRGNVMAVVGDKKKGTDENTDGIVDHYNADVISANDYYPFGMLQPGRSYSSGNGYRYGYNGKEKDNEVKGEGNQIDYGMRVYDPRLGKFLSVDPLTQQYPWYTPYQYAGNKPIKFVDRDGEEESDPDKYYKKAIPVIKTTFANNIKRLPNDERASTSDAMSTAFNRVHVFTLYGRYLSARLMTRWLEGQGGYDILSYKALSHAGGAFIFNHQVNAVEKNIKMQALAQVSTLKEPGTHSFSVGSYVDYQQGGAVLSDLGTALGSYSVYGTGQFTVNIDKNGKKEVLGDIYFTLADKYQWKPGRGANLEEEVDHDTMLKLEKVGAKPFYIRSYFQASYRGDQDGLEQVGNMKNSVYDWSNSTNPNPEPKPTNGYALPANAKKVNDSRGE